jgi:CheY-like chemotaxis protein
MSVENQFPESLRRLVQNDEPSEGSVPSRPEVNHGCTDLNLLLVEDDPDDIFLIREALAATGFDGKVMMSIDGQEALEYIMGAGPFSDRSFFPVPGLILLDLNLPKRNGFEVLQFLKRHKTLKRVPVVVLTTSSLQSDVDAAYELGANGYLQKPGNFPAFIEGLKRVWTCWKSDFKRPSLN